MRRVTLALSIFKPVLLPYLIPYLDFLPYREATVGFLAYCSVLSSLSKPINFKQTTSSMLIGLCGGEFKSMHTTQETPSVRLTSRKGICAGKQSVARYLVQHYDFSEVYLARMATTPLVEQSATQVHIPRYPRSKREENCEDRSFKTVEQLLDFVTKRWQQRWVTTDVWDESVLETLLRRPFFLFVSVDAPVSLRWKRFKER